MYKIFYEPGYANVFYPESQPKEPLAVTEIGHAHQPAGFDSGDIRRDIFVLQYIGSGECTFNGIDVKSPAIIFIKPNAPARYKIPVTCNDFSAYWIKFGGEQACELVKNAGFGHDNEVFTPVKVQETEKVFADLTGEENYEGADDSLYMLGGLYRLMALNSGISAKTETKKISAYTRTVLDHIHTNYKESISEKDLAGLVNLSTNYMHKVFLSDMQVTPINYLNYYRIQCAKKILKDTDYSISKIAEAVGISGGDYFCRVFRKYTGGTSPTEYRKAFKKRIIQNQ